MTITSWNDAIDAYDDMLDENDTVRIGTLTYAPSHVLRHIDPTAYRTGLHDWLDSEGIDSDDLDDYGVHRIPD